MENGLLRYTLMMRDIARRSVGHGFTIRKLALTPSIFHICIFRTIPFAGETSRRDK